MPVEVRVRVQVRVRVPALVQPAARAVDPRPLDCAADPVHPAGRDRLAPPRLVRR